MKSTKDLKQKIHDQLLIIINSKIELLESVMESARESRDSDTKSSAGDKHETSRAMVQIEMENSARQLAQNVELRQALHNIQTDKTHNRVEQGSLVFTDSGIYYISIGHGKIELDKKDYFAISTASPLGQVLNGKQKAESINFQNRVIHIENIL